MEKLEKMIVENGITYVLGENDIYYPDLQLPEGTNYNIGKFGHMRCEYLKEFKHGYYMELLFDGRLNEYLHEVDKECYEMLDQLVEQMKEKQGVTEQLKAEYKLLPISAYKREYAKANAGLSTQLSFDFLNDIPEVVESKKYAEITYGYRYGDMTHLYIVLPSSDYKGIEHSTNLLEDIKIYEKYVPEDLVEESIVSLKKSLSKEIEKII